MKGVMDRPKKNYKFCKRCERKEWFNKEYGWLGHDREKELEEVLVVTPCPYEEKQEDNGRV